MRAAEARANYRLRALLKQVVYGSTLEQRESFYDRLPGLLMLAIEYTREVERCWSSAFQTAKSLRTMSASAFA